MIYQRVDQHQRPHARTLRFHLGFQLFRLAWWLMEGRKATVKSYAPGEHPEQRLVARLRELLEAADDGPHKAVPIEHLRAAIQEWERD
jgi:hypothetical protein